MENTVLNWELLIKCLKYVAEHQELSYEDMHAALEDLGWRLTIKDVARTISRPPVVTSVAVGIKYGDYFTGANMLANIISNPMNYKFVLDKFLSNDGNVSIYEYIRVVTKDPNYTLENIQSNSKISI